MKALVYDIDGCIIENYFPRLNYKKQKDREIKEIVRRMNEKLKRAKLYPSFKEFYNKKCVFNISIFITGRKESQFGDITKDLLEDLYFKKIIFYPEDLDHSKSSYYRFKVQEIKSIQHQYKIENTYIFDDDLGYFTFLPDGSKTFHCKNNKHWEELISISNFF